MSVDASAHTRAQTQEARQRAVEALGVLDTPPDERVDRITRMAQDMFDVPMVSVTLLDRDRQWRKSQIGLGGNEAPREGAFCDATVNYGGDTMIVDDASGDDRFAENPFVVGDPHLRFYAGHPLSAPGGELVGTLCVLDTKPRSFDDKQRRLLQELAGWVQAELAASAEIDQAVVAQHALLPRRSPDVPGYRFAAVARPAHQVLGDLYDWYESGDDVALTVADVMGKGPGAAIVAAQIRASLRTGDRRAPYDAMRAVEELLNESIGELSVFATLFHGRLHTPTGVLTYVDAGHSLGYVHRETGWEHLTATATPLGLGLDSGLESSTTVLRPGETFVCVSDGVLDIVSAEDPLGDIAGFLEDADPDEAVARIRRRAIERRAPDDVTALVVRRDA